jgi:amino acid transporter
MSDPAGPTGTEAFGYRQELRRSLGLADLLVYGLIFIAPIAPLSVFGFVFNISNGMVPLVYVVGLAAMMFTGFSYVAMSRAFPIAGSVYVYAGRGIGESVGFLAGWAMLLDYVLLPTLVCSGIAVTMTAVLPDVPKPVWVVTSLVLATGVNLMGIGATAMANRLLLCLQLLLLLTFVVLGVLALQRGVGGAHLSLAPFWDASKVTPHLIFGALSVAALSFLGFDAISTLSEEVKGSDRLVGTATLLSLALVGLLFVGQTYLASLFVLGRPPFPPGDASANAFLFIARLIGGEPFKLFTILIGVSASLAGALAAQAATARLLFSMARDGKLPRALAHVDARTKSPQRATLLVAALTLGLALFFVSHLQLLVSLVNFGALFGFLMLHLSVVIHFFWKGRSGRWIAHLAAPVAGFAVIAYVLVSTEPLAKIAGGVWLAIGTVILISLKVRGARATLPAEAL